MQQGLKEGFTGQRIQVIPQPVTTRALSTAFTQNLFATDSGYFPNANLHLRKRESGTEELIVLLCTRGAGWVTTGSSTHQVRPGQLVLIAPHTPHAYGASRSDPWSIWWCHLQGSTVVDSLRYFPKLASQPLLQLRRPERVQRRLQDLLESMERDSGQLLLEVNTGLSTALLGELIADRKHPQRGEPLERAMHYLQQNVEQTITVPQVAQLVGLSASHLSTLFRKATGTGVLAYHTSLKMERARQLLDTSSLSIAQISAAIGYADQFYFSRHFKASHGVSPTGFRSRNQA